MGTLKHFDAETLAEIVQLEELGENGLIESLTNDYQANFNRILTEMKTASLAGDYKTLERESHSLKSSSNLLGLQILGSLCAAIEHQAHDKIIDNEKLSLLDGEFQTAFPELSHFAKQKRAA